MNRTAAAAVTLFALAAGTTLLVAGPLNPPAGPVTGTYKTLSEVEPRIAINAVNTPGDADSLFKITQPGSYYLTGNITGVVGKHGIEIAASGVTIDLNGFDLVGVPGMGAFDGVIAAVLNARNIAVINGSVREWGDDGIDLGLSITNNNRVERVLASSNGDDGIVGGRSSTLVSCSAYQNAGIGINVGSFCTVSGCTASDNTGTGISTGEGCTVSNCIAYSNAIGINTGTGGTVRGCSAYDNLDIGISVSAGSTISNCTAYSNGSSGIFASAGSAVLSTAAYANTGAGINVSTGCTVELCTLRNNTLDGILCSSSCVIRGNTCSFNGSNAGDGAGIHATGSDNRIEDNNCAGADRGIDVDAAGNIIIRNTCAGNTLNWSIAANNVVGPILDRTAPASAAISGNSAPDSTGSTHPNANFTY